ncbi:hypothetical protein EUTSA_v10026917mg [Eutrema salsugineum]|uniref:Defensin-like protein n=1 Tax=Eutrema salsugineum TaxID=72664 RepID=V4LUB0_EUTSA|nr:hypothetical protein EUTSA_v10026917mg [Eutrema salsugineum]
MAKSTSSIVIPIIFLVMFFVEQNMGCLTSIGMCTMDVKDCDASCKSKFGQKATGLCTLKKELGQCLCSHHCSADRAHTSFVVKG